jgi:ubiquitin-protein ligase
MSEENQTDLDRDDSDSEFTTQASNADGGVDDVRIADYQPETPSNYVTLDTFAELTAHLKASRCRICDEPFFSSELDIRNLFKDWADGTVDQLSCTIRCSNCNTRSCIACEPQPYTKSSTIGYASPNRKHNVSWCCVGGRLFLIWALLCGFDRHIWESRNLGKIPKQTKQQSKSRKKATKSTRGGPGSMGGNRPPMGPMPSGLGYGGNNSSSSSGQGYMFDDDTDEYEEDDEDVEPGIHGLNFDATTLENMYGKAPNPPVAFGYSIGSGIIQNSKRPAPSKKDDKISKAQSAQKAEDVFSRMILGFLTNLLPSLERETCFDFDPPTATSEMLQHSKILQFCAELLRNDSLADVTKRKELYRTLFTFLTMVGSHSSTSAALFGPRFVRPESIDILTISFQGAVPDSKEWVSTLVECLQNLSTQSSMVLQSTRTNMRDFKDKDGQDMLWVCHQIRDLAKFFQMNTVSGADMVPDTDSANGKATAKVPDGLALGEVEESLFKQTYYYWNQAHALSFSQPGRFKRLITEITTLQTGLPPGIFVRYCENRPDILKCVIVGPTDTPYENGLFEFDIFCGAMFPNTPPQVHFKGTAGGLVSINPNLYADGKVCLSLLGTWSGEPWNPGESTLLQVLISIQAMILCEEPWYNEPGREAGYTSSPKGPSAMYNRKIREHTIRTAILAWLNDPSPLWKDVVDYHFKQQGNSILRTAEIWTKERADEASNSIPARKSFAEFDDFEEAVAAAMAAGRYPPETSNMGAMLQTLQPALKRYGATFVVEYVAPPAPEIPTVPHGPGNFMPESSPWPSSWPSVSGSTSTSPDHLAAFQAADALLNGGGNNFGGYLMPPIQQNDAMRGGSNRGRGHPIGTFGRGHVTAESHASASASASGSAPEGPRYDLRSSTLGRGSSDEASTRGGRGGSSSSIIVPPSNTMSLTAGRGVYRGGFARGRGRGYDGTGVAFPFPPPGPNSFGRGGGGPPPGDGLTMADASPWTRGAPGRGRGRGGGRGDRGAGYGRGRGGGRGDRGSSGP